MSIILPLGHTVQAYLLRYGREGPELELGCPACGGSMRRHGRYWRWVATRRCLSRIPIYRWWCPTCRRTCSVLPDFLRPYARFVTLVREAVIRRRLQQGLPWADLVHRASSVAVSLVSEKTLRRWVRRTLEAAGEWGQFLAQHILEVWPAVDLFALTRRRGNRDAGLHFLLELGDWYRQQVGRSPAGHPGLFPLLNRLADAPCPL